MYPAFNTYAIAAAHDTCVLAGRCITRAGSVTQTHAYLQTGVYITWPPVAAGPILNPAS